MQRRGTTSLTRWLIAAAVLAAIVAAVLVITATRSGRATYNSRFDNRAQLSAQFTAEFIDQTARSERRVAEEQLGGKISQERFDEIVANNDFAASVLLDAEGDLLNVSPASNELERTNFASRYDHLTRALEGETAVSDIVPSAAEAAPIIAVAVPFRAQGQRRVLSSGYKITETPLDAFLRASISTPRAKAYLVDGAGRVITSNDPDSIGEQLTSVRSDLDDIPTSGSGDDQLDGEATHYVSRRVEGSSWRLVMTVPHATLYAPLRPLTIVQWSAFALLLLLLGLVALLITRLVRAEALLARKVTELESANRALDAFSHTLVHDLRNPLAVIGGFASTLDRMVGQDRPELREMTGHIETSTKRMQTLIEDVLALATVNQNVEREECDPRVILDEAIGNVPDVKVDVGWLPPTMSVDRSSVYRALQNMLQNASIYASNQAGIAHVWISADETPWSWVLVIEDAGPGIPEAEQGRIFQPFERGREERPGTGTGLGLAIVASCAQVHGGEAHVSKSPAHGGARFTIEIRKPEDSVPTTADRRSDTAQRPLD